MPHNRCVTRSNSLTKRLNNSYSKENDIALTTSWSLKKASSQENHNFIELNFVLVISYLNVTSEDLGHLRSKKPEKTEFCNTGDYHYGNNGTIKVL